jgi:hypothetical protein
MQWSYESNTGLQKVEGGPACQFFRCRQKQDRFKFSALFGQLSLKILGRQQWLILRVEEDQQELSKLRVF